MLFWSILDSLERRVSGALSPSLKMLLVNLRFLLHDKEFRDEVIGKKWICLERHTPQGECGPSQKVRIHYSPQFLHTGVIASVP